MNRIASALVAIALSFASTAIAQENGTVGDADIQRAAHLLAADWRPFSQPPVGSSAAGALATICDGAAEEMAAVDARIPDPITPDALAAIRAPHGFIIVPTAENPATVFLFPNADLTTITSGLGAIRVVSTTLGRVDLIDAAGQETQLQIGAAAGRPMLRILREGRDPLLFVGCGSSVG